MHDNSYLFIQTSQAEMIQNNQFDTIYHEHISFFNINSMNELAKRTDLNLIDVIKTPVHGISYLFIFSKKDINIEYANNLLTVESVKDEDTKEVEENDGVLFKGISKRQFKKSFTVADDVVINGAELKDGMLVIDLEKIVPEEKKPRTIKIK